MSPKSGGGPSAVSGGSCSSACWSSLRSRWARLLPSSRRSGHPASAWTWPAGSPSSTRPKGSHVSPADLNETVNILNHRVNGLGVSGAQVQTTGNNQISVSIPGVKNAQRCSTRSGRRPAVLPAGAVLRLPGGAAQARPRRPQAQPPGHRERCPPAQSSTQLTAANLDVHAEQLRPGVHVQQRPARPAVRRPIPSTSTAEAELREQHRPPARACRPAAAPRGQRCVLGPSR